MPPSAIAGMPARLAIAAARNGPNAVAPGCERVANTGETKIASTRDRRAAMLSPSECTAALRTPGPAPL